MTDQNDHHDPQHPPTESSLEIPVLVPEDDVKGLADVKQLGMVAAIGSLSYVFWIVGGMEMVERLAFYGVKAVAALYATDPQSRGGLGINMSQFGTILMVWAFVQSFLPIFTGGLSDRYGYKETIFCSTVLKIIGYLLMAFFPFYWGFFAGAIVLAAGTAVFKPGIQGTLVKSTKRENSSMAWGIFYQTVNIGGFLGPLVAGLMRKMEWQYVFFACAGIICLNFLLLLTYKEVGKEERLEHKRLVADGKLKQSGLAAESLRELAKPHVWTYLAVFSGFWFMFNSLFDVLPVHIDDWVNSSDVVTSLFPSGQSNNAIVNFFVVMNAEGTAIEPEGMLNVNAGMIMLVCFVFAWISGLMRATTSMVVGTLMATLALFMCGQATTGWFMLAAIALFSTGEMLSSPKFLEFIGNFAPKDKKAMYLGFSQIPLAVGWTIEAKVGPKLYDIYASKDRFSKELLAERLGAGEGSLPDAAQIEAIVNQAGYYTLNEDKTVDTLFSYQDIVALEGDDFEKAANGVTDYLRQVELGLLRVSPDEVGTLLTQAREAGVTHKDLSSIMPKHQAAVIENLAYLPEGATKPLEVENLLALDDAQFTETVAALTQHLGGIEHGLSDVTAGEVGRLISYAEKNKTSLEALETSMLEQPTEFISEIPQGEGFDWLVTITGESREALTTLLYDTHDVSMVWNIMGAVGILSAIGIAIYGKWVLTIAKK